VGGGFARASLLVTQNLAVVGVFGAVGFGLWWGRRLGFRLRSFRLRCRFGFGGQEAGVPYTAEYCFYRKQ
jgi:hypothetical protein